MKLIFLGSGEFGLPTLQALVNDAAHEIVAVISQPDKPAGRKRRLTPTPIAAWADANGLTVLKTDNVNAPEFVAQVAAFEADASIVIAFGQKLGEDFIAALGRLAVNLHASLLPAYRGAAPINWAVINDDRVTGVSVIALAQRMDAGDVYATAKLDIAPTETAGELHDRLAQLGPDAISKVLRDLGQDTLDPQPQDESKATKARKLSKADGTVDFNQTAFDVRARIHGLTPWPGCRVNLTSKKNGKTQAIFLRRALAEPEMACFPGLEQAEPPPVPGIVLPDHRIACADGAVRLVEMQLPGKPVVTLEAFLNGHAFEPGDMLSPIDLES